MSSLEIVKIHIDHARQKLGISSRTELAALALSRRYGAMSILAAAILAALDDSVDAGHAATESFTVMAANGSAEVVTIKISRKETVSGGTPARGAEQRSAAPAPATGTSWPTGKLVDPRGRDCREPICAGSTERAEAEVRAATASSWLQLSVP